jgi:hypothetical protein
VKFDAAEKRGVAGGDACVPVASAASFAISFWNLSWIAPFFGHTTTVDLIHNLRGFDQSDPF